MSGTDQVNLKVNRLRKRYQDAIEDVRKENEQNLSELKKSYEAKNQTAVDNYKKDRERIEQKNLESIERYKEKLSETMSKKSQDYEDSVRQMKKDYENLNKKDREGVQEKLNRISNEYNEKERTLDQRTFDQVFEVKRQADRRQLRDRIGFSQDMELYEEHTKDRMRELGNSNAKEIKDLNNRHKDFLLASNTRHIQEKEALKKNLMDYAGKLKNQNTDEKSAMRETFENNIKAINENKNFQQVKMEKNYSGIIQNNAAKAEQQRRTTEKDLLNQLDDVKKQAFDRSRRNNTVVNELKTTNRTNQRVNEQMMGEVKRKIKLVGQRGNDKINVAEDNFQKQLNELGRQNQNSRIREREALLSQANEEKNQIITDKIATVNREKQDNKIEVSKYQQQLRDQERSNQIRLFEANLANKKMLQQRSIERSQQMSEVSERNRNALKAMQENHENEKIEYMEETRDRVAKTDLNLRKTFGDKISKLEQRQEQQVQMLQDTLDRTIKKYEALLVSTKNQGMQELEDFKKLAKDQMDIQKKNFQHVLEQKELDRINEKTSMKQEFAKKLTDTKEAEELRVMDITNRYERQINTERKNYYKALKQKLTEAHRQLENLRNRSEVEKNNIRVQLNTRISDLQRENLKIRQLNEERKQYLDPVDPDKIDVS
ncbi:MAG: hypothetical protein ACPGJV_12160 [Bacteriovoracaceae bacterium]